MKKHRTKLLRLATNLSSRESGFVFALLGVFVQAAHTWFLAYDLSSLPGIWRLLQAGLMALFISAALLYFTLKSSDEDTPQAKKYRRIVWWFACVETFINLYYWGDHLLIKPWPNPDYGSFIIAIPFSILLPFVLKSYGSEVRTEDYSELNDDEEKIASKESSKHISEPSPELVEYVVNELKKSQVPNDKYFEWAPITMEAPDDAQGKVTTATTNDIQQSEEPIHAQEYSSDTKNEPEHISNKEDSESNTAAITSSVEDTEQVSNIEEELLPPSTENTQDEVVPVYDAQGNDARIDTEETVVSKPTFSGTPEIKNGTFASIPAYVKANKQ